jgi:hypothetical protein
VKVLFLPEVRQYLAVLSQVLYDRNYFSYVETTERYVKTMIDEITQTLPFRQMQPVPAHFEQYGENMSYAVFKKSKNTQWYVFFNLCQDQRGEILYVVL